MSKHNYFINFSIKINQFINSLLKRNLNKLNAANLKKTLINNKVFLTIVLLTILFFSYLSLPNIFNKNQISVELKKNLLNKLNLEFNFGKKLNYKFLPRPHFIINESSVIFNENKISNINELKIYLSLKNLFSIKSIKIQDFHFKNHEKIVLLLGSERNGIENINLLDKTIAIPMYGRNSSMNVIHSLAITLYEVTNQIGHKI